MPEAGALRILLVDDEEDIRASLRRVLARLPVERIEFEEAPNGEEAIRLVRKGFFHVVMSDYRMGRVTGVDLLEIARLEQPHSVRVLMTAYEDMEIAQQAVNRARIDAFVRKPWENAKLLDLLASLLAERWPPQAA